MTRERPERWLWQGWDSWAQGGVGECTLSLSPQEARTYITDVIDTILGDKYCCLLFVTNNPKVQRGFQTPV